MFIRMCACAHICMHAHICMCARVCICMCMCAFICVCLSVCAFICVSIYPYVYMCVFLSAGVLVEGGFSLGFANRLVGETVIIECPLSAAQLASGAELMWSRDISIMPEGRFNTTCALGQTLIVRDLVAGDTSEYQCIVGPAGDFNLFFFLGVFGKPLTSMCHAHHMPHAHACCRVPHDPAGVCHAHHHCYVP